MVVAFINEVDNRRMPVRDPYTKHRFRLEIDGVSSARFRTVEGLVWENEVLEFQEGGRNDALVRLPAQGRLGKLILKRGHTNDEGLMAWARACAKANGDDSVRRNVEVVVCDEAGQEVRRFTLFRAWPTKFTLDELSSVEGLAMESMELVHEGMVASGSNRDGLPGALGGLRNAAEVRVEDARRRATEAARSARERAAAGQSPGQSSGALAEASALLEAEARAAVGGLDPREVLPPSVPAGIGVAAAAYSGSTSVPSAGALGSGTVEVKAPPATPAEVIAHGSDASFAAAAGSAPSGLPSDPKGTGAPGSDAGFAVAGEKGASAVSQGDWSDGVSRKQPPDALREPPIEPGGPGNRLRF